ncbi:hypothetical protein GCM10027072_73410 [Streptomyces bullii]
MRITRRRRLAERPGDQSFDLLVRDLSRRPRTRPVCQALQPVRGEPGPPLAYGLARDAQVIRDSRVRQALRARQHDPRPQHQRLRGGLLDPYFEEADGHDVAYVPGVGDFESACNANRAPRIDLSELIASLREAPSLTTAQWLAGPGETILGTRVRKVIDGYERPDVVA